ncbi:MAG: VOC family protein [Clostridia bacterium]|nr:VOC family protein [Clostridia bacterium]
MTISHFALYTNDLERIKNFYTRYFGGTAGVKYSNSRSGFSSYFIRFDDGISIEVMTRPSLTGRHPSDEQCGWAHLAFKVENEDAVRALCEKLRREGVTIKSEPRTTGDGYYECVILDPDGNTVEITA